MWCVSCVEALAIIGVREFAMLCPAGIRFGVMLCRCWVLFVLVWFEAVGCRGDPSVFIVDGALRQMLADDMD